MKSNLITFTLLALVIAFVSGCANTGSTTSTETTTVKKDRTKGSMYAR